MRFFAHKNYKCILKNRFYYTYLICLIVFGAIFYSIFSFNIAMPQMGWWQYFGSRILEGDVPYKDFYFYLPPYHAFYAAVLYKVFSNHIIYYTIYGFIVNKTISWAIMYNLLTRRYKCWQACIGLIFGIVLTAVYQMDLTFDYNPLVTTLWLFLILFLVKYYESLQSNKYIYVILSSIIAGIICMIKQNVGLIAPFVLCLGIILISKIKKENIVRNIVYLTFGLLISILPGIIYLYVNDALYDAKKCIISSLHAKGVGNGFFLTTVRNMWRPTYLAYALLIISVYILVRKHNNDIKKSILCLCLAISLGVDSTDFLQPVWGFLNNNSHPKVSTVLMCLLVVVFFVMSCFVIVKQNVIATTCIYVTVFLMTTLGTLFFSVSQRMFFAEELNIFSCRRALLYVFFYLLMIMWLVLTYRIFKWEKCDLSFYIFITGILIYMGISFTSATLEELYAVTFVPIVICEILVTKTKTIVIKNNLLIIFVLVVTFLGVCEKTTKPYEWHAWRVPALYDEDNPLVLTDISGLEGIALPQSDADKYSEIVDAINNNSTQDDVLYQFPNIMLFNVLTERKTTYYAVPYFDVFPDEMAIENANYLKENCPKLVLWADLNESRWEAHENAFRNGNRSGQRELQNWYNTYVKNSYRCLGTWDNNEGDGETISLWKKTSYSPGELTDMYQISSSNTSFEQSVNFLSESFNRYCFAVESDKDSIPVKINLLNLDGDLINNLEGTLKKDSEGFWFINSGEDIAVNVNEEYILQVEFKLSDEEIAIRRTAEQTGEVYDIDNNIYNEFNLGIYCE
ncbi:Dolichyl-phosphate-mannose-protein mannosyltransferase [Lachnospiraceae bacterium A10]|nr:Dolichyl-phosphate-mannose-protein mannosyltransferase [Lachnospiraceae bacterium A10]